LNQQNFTQTSFFNSSSKRTILNLNLDYYFCCGQFRETASPLTLSIFNSFLDKDFCPTRLCVRPDANEVRSHHRDRQQNLEKIQSLNFRLWASSIPGSGVYRGHQKMKFKNGKSPLKVNHSLVKHSE
jgi:hypothetical protein